MLKSIYNIDFIGNARILEYLEMSDDHIPTGYCRHSIGGEKRTDFMALAICKYTGVNGFYLFYCDESWEEINDSYHETIDEAKKQAEFEYTGTKNDWRKK